MRPGQVTGFLGPNGAGKSTTLRMILGLDAPTAGTATVSGVPFHRHPRGLRHVGALLDAGQVHGGRSATAHLSALARSNGIRRRRVDEVLQEVGLADVANRRIGGFSLGVKQRLGIATALLGDPGAARALAASALLAPVSALVGLGLGVLLRHAAGTMVTSVFALLMLPTMFAESNRWSADVKHAMVSAAWNRLVQTWEPDPGSLAYTATGLGSWIVYTLWPLITVAVAVLVVSRRDV